MYTENTDSFCAVRERRVLQCDLLSISVSRLYCLEFIIQICDNQSVKAFERRPVIMKKITILICMICMALSTIVSAEEPEYFISEDGNFRYVLLEDNTIEITSYIGDDDYEYVWSVEDGFYRVYYAGDNGEQIELEELITLDVPAELDGHTVTSIGKNAFTAAYCLQSITLPESMASIGNFAFFGCQRLRNIKLPDSLTTIGDNAFHACMDLEEIVIPESVTDIGVCAFWKCHSLKSVTMPDNLTSIRGGVFSECSSLTDISLPEKLMSIGDSVFSDCTSLVNIVLPEELMLIGGGAFANCSSLTDITIPESVIVIKGSAFDYCENLTISVCRDSYAEEYCKENDLNYSYSD